MEGEEFGEESGKDDVAVMFMPAGQVGPTFDPTGPSDSLGPTPGSWIVKRAIDGFHAACVREREKP